MVIGVRSNSTRAMEPQIRIPRFLRDLALELRRFWAWLLCHGVQTPTDVTASVSGGAILVAWNGDSTNVGAYLVERAENGGPYQNRVWVGAGALPGEHAFAWADTSVDLGRRYCYRITAQHTNGSRGCPAAPVCIEGCNGLPTATDVTGIAWGATENRLIWKCDATNIAQFRIERSIGTPAAFQFLTNVPAGSQGGVQSYTYSDHGVQGGVLYCYRIASENAAGTRGCFTTPVCAGTQIF